MQTIAVLITCYNRKEKTLNCLRSLYKNQVEGYRFDVFLTNDGCTDGTPEAVADLYPQVHIIQGDGTLYWNRGMYVAWQEAAKYDYDFYLWLNDDTILKKDAIERLLRISSMLGDRSIVVGSTSDNDGHLSYGGRKSDKKHTLITPNMKSAVECATFNGNIVLIPSYVFNQVRFNDPYFHHSFGDIEYGLRAGKLSIKSYIAPGFYGICERNNPIPLFRRKQYPLWKRYKLLYSPLGFNPLEDFHLNMKYYPLYKAVMWFIRLHINVLFAVDHTNIRK